MTQKPWKTQNQVSNLDTWEAALMRVWFNLHKRVWSTKVAKEHVRHVQAVRLVGAEFVVNERERLKVIERRCRSVHAYATGQGAEVTAPVGVLVGYNPYRGGAFYRKDTGTDVWAADELHFLPNGTVLAVNPR
jgi:hypothetical protein